jgi:hypothetical protein
MIRPGVLAMGATTMKRFIKRTCVSFVLTFAVLNGLHAAFVHRHPLATIGAHRAGLRAEAPGSSAGLFLVLEHVNFG